MSLDRLQRVDRAYTSLWFVLADQEHASELEEALSLLAPKLDEAEGATSVLVLPRQTAGGSILRPALAEGLELKAATHGSVLEPCGIYILPADRLFVMENQMLHLRPRDLAHQISPCDHLLPSLARQYRSHLNVLLIADAPPPEGQTLSLVRALGGRIMTLDDLRFHPEAILEETAATGDVQRNQRREQVAAPRGLPVRLAHDLRQPLQTLTLLQSLLSRQVHEPKAVELVNRLGDTLSQMTDLILNPELAAQTYPAPMASQESMDVVDDDEGPLLTADGEAATVYIIDDDRSIREALRGVLEEEGCIIRDFESCEAFLEDYTGDIDGCLLVDAYLPGMSGIELLDRLHQSGPAIPAIMITGSSDVHTAVRAMKAGATDFIEKPVSAHDLLSGVRQALARARDSGEELATREKAVHCLRSLTRRQKQIMAMVLEGHPSKIIAADLGISQRTVENHRAAIMKKTGSRSLPALARLAMALPR